MYDGHQVEGMPGFSLAEYFHEQEDVRKFAQDQDIVAACLARHCEIRIVSDEATSESIV
jgi:hypothetical protein